MKIFIKGGPWKNIEDEILKAAVMKYGKNQWDRIASLLSRKSAKQCKARWYEWLDPSITKTDWTKEEEEKLLHLVKIMPTQWRTIGPIVGRTAHQCMEHFEFLLDKYQERDETYSEEDDPRRLKSGEIDYNAEIKPALPDPVDMDEDEKEMLSEVRARMANTMGKKAKRRARERQLEERRRLSLLKKKRELKAAGIYVIEDNITKKKKMKNRFKKINFLKEIPFQKRVPVGYHDVSRENARVKPVPFERSLETIEGRQRDKKEFMDRKKDKQKLDRMRTEKTPNFVKNVNRLNALNFNRKRAKLLLPKPQIDDEQLKMISKVGHVHDSDSDSDEETPSFTKKLLSNYSATPINSTLTPFPSLRGVRTPMPDDSMKMQTHEIVTLTNLQTPLAGGEGPGRKEILRKRKRKIGEGSVSQTPNPFLNPQKRMKNTVRNTPFRDELQINEPDSILFTISGKKSKMEKRKNAQFKREKLRKSFLSIPKPKKSKYFFQSTGDDESDSEEED